jgi:hypothetical protein
LFTDGPFECWMEKVASSRLRSAADSIPGRAL